MKPRYREDEGPYVVLCQEGEYDILVWEDGDITIEFNAKADGTIELGLLHFDGWNRYSEHKEIPKAIKDIALAYRNLTQ